MLRDYSTRQVPILMETRHLHVIRAYVYLKKKVYPTLGGTLLHRSTRVCLPEKEGISNPQENIEKITTGVCLPEKEGISNLSVLFAPEHHGVCLPEKEGISNQAAEDYYAFVAYVYLKKKVYPTWRSS